MNRIALIARAEWRLLLRNRVAVLGLALTLGLAVVAALTSWQQRSAVQAERERHQHAMDHAFEAQPDRHPHRMVHYGHFAFRTLNPLAAFDPGTDAFTGYTLFLEGHRQNSANFGEARQSSLLLRFGQLSPALVLQLLAPLLLVFIGHGVIAREREAGTLRLLLAQGLPAGPLLAGKGLALAGVAALLWLPAALALLAAGSVAGAPALLAAALALAYAAWLALWVLGVLLASSLLPRPRDALLVLLAIWALGSVVAPRLAAEWASQRQPLPTRIETDLTIQRELAQLGNSHNAADTRFGEFRRQVLAEHGVSRIEDLPVNYKGLVAMEGERQTSELFDRYAAEGFVRQQAQTQLVDSLAWLSPVLALRRVSMALAGTDLAAYQRFLDQAEQHRYTLVQALNRLQAEQMTLAGDRSSRDDRISRAHWQGIAGFSHRAEAAAPRLARALPAAGVMGAWLVTLTAACAWAGRRLTRNLG
jgi:ABC-2 type transport system permease protein